MGTLAELIKTRLTNLAASEPALEPVPVEQPVPELDPVTRAARDRMKELTLGRFVYLDEMSDEEIRQWRRRHRLAMMEPPPNRWLGNRRSIWERD
jgi:hypothetical protein